MSNRYIFCKNKSEVAIKTLFKGLSTKVLYCIVDDEIFVYQGLRTIPITLELFAEGMEIDLFEAQRIVSDKVLFENFNDTKPEYPELFKEETNDIVNDVKNNTVDNLAAVKESTSETLGDLAQASLYKVETIKDNVNPMSELEYRISTLEFKIDQILNHIGLNLDSHSEEVVEIINEVASEIEQQEVVLEEIKDSE